MLIVKEVGD